jgi:hypothetical protein
MNNSNKNQMPVLRSVRLQLNNNCNLSQLTHNQQERVRDLLDARHGTPQEVKLEVRQDQLKGNFVPGLTAREVRYLV